MYVKKLRLNIPMNRSHLIQRLLKPNGRSNPFAFGGGLARGGVAKQGMQILEDIFSFDYMGSAEFEWGRVPAALDFIREQAQDSSLASGQHTGVYYLCPNPYEDGVKTVIDGLLEDEVAMRLKEYCELKDAVIQQAPGSGEIVGWLELDNGFFLFTDMVMFDKTRLVFVA